MCFFFQQDLFFTERIWKVHCLETSVYLFDQHFFETSLSNWNSVILAAFCCSKGFGVVEFHVLKAMVRGAEGPTEAPVVEMWGSTCWVRMVSDDISHPKAFLSRWYSFFKGIMLVSWRACGIPWGFWGLLQRDKPKSALFGCLGW